MTNPDARAIEVRTPQAPDPVGGLENANAEPPFLEQGGCVQSGETSTDDDDVAIGRAHRSESSGSSLPPSAGFAGPGRPDRQQLAGQ